MDSKAQERQWQAESDAETMARYQEILGDKARMSRAVKVAQQRANDLNKRATAMQTVAKFKNGGSLRGSFSRAASGKSAGSRSTGRCGRKK